MTKNRPAAPRSTIAPLTPKELRGIALELRRHAGKFADTEMLMTKFLDRADELRAEATAIEQRERERRWYAEREREWMRGRK